METNKINELLKHYVEGTCSAEERKLIERHLLDYLDKEGVKQPSKEQFERSFDETYTMINLTIDKKRQSGRIISWRRTFPYAAAILIIIGIGSQLFRTREGHPSGVVNQTNTVSTRHTAVLPGTNKATLTLNGKEVIQLSEKQAGVQIKENEVSYTDGSIIKPTDDNKVASNYVLATPRGGTYQLRLPDGSQVWLNAASSISYSGDLAKGKIRQVNLEGEAYFEVAKDRERPFIVHTDREQIEVLGTHFNVNSYPEDSKGKITLLEGSVRVNKNTLLKPDEEAIVDNNGRIQTVHVDAQKSIAWKNGKFVFASEDLESVMQKLSRWYDVEIVYKERISGKTFSGTLNRFDDIHKVLNMIAYSSGIKFNLEERRIIVMP